MDALDSIPSFIEPQPSDADIPDTIDHRRLTKHDTQSGPQHSEETKAYALAVFAETGSTTTAGHAANVPASTVHAWVSRDPDIDAKLDSLRRVIRERVAWKYAEGAELAVDVVLDRLKNGDQVLDKEGNIKLRPVPAREAAFIASIFTDKHALLAGTMTKTNPEDQALTTLFAKMVTELERKRAKVRVIDAPTYPQASEPDSA